MTTRLYTHPIYLDHLTPPGHPERPDRLRALEEAFKAEAFEALERIESPRADDEKVLLAHPEQFLDRVKQAIPHEGIVQGQASHSA